VKKSKSYNSKVKTPVLAVIWLRSFCAVTHIAPKPPSKKKKLQKVRLRKMKKEMAPKRCPTEVEEKNEETRFSSRTQALC